MKRSRRKSTSRAVIRSQALESRALLAASISFQQEVFPQGPNTINAEFGGAIDIDGDIGVVGARLAYSGSTPESHSDGRVMIYRRNEEGTPGDESDDTWDLETEILRPPGLSGLNDSGFGFDVTISGTTIAISSFGFPDGNVSIYDETAPNTWTLSQIISLPSDSTFRGFGQSIDMDGDLLAVGSATGNTSQTGKAWVFERDNAGVWNQKSELIGSTVVPGDRFGRDVALSGTRVLVGAGSSDTVVGTNTGAAFVFDSDGNELAALTATTPVPNSFFGNSVSLDGTTAVVGARGAAHIFTESAGIWSEEQVVTDSATLFAEEVRVQGSRLLVANPRTTAAGVFYGGNVNLYEDNGTSWSLTQTLQSPSPTHIGQLGLGMSIDGDTLWLGEPRAETDVPLAGAVVSYGFDGTNWNSTQRFFDVTETGQFTTAQESFGDAVKISGDWAAVGSPNYQPNNPTSRAGRVTMYQRNDNGTPADESDDTWTWHSEIISPATLGLNFGDSIDISGNVMAVGSSREVPGGAVYIFRFDGTSWNQEALFTGSQVAANDFFADQLDLDSTGTKLVVNEQFDDEVYIFEYDGTSWAETAVFTGFASPARVEDLAIEGDMAAVGTPNVTSDGAIQIYRKTGGVWAFEQTLLEPETQTGRQIEIANGFMVTMSRNSYGYLNLYDLSSGITFVDQVAGTSSERFDFIMSFDGEVIAVPGNSGSSSPTLLQTFEVSASGIKPSGTTVIPEHITAYESISVAGNTIFLGHRTARNHGVAEVFHFVLNETPIVANDVASIGEDAVPNTTTGNVLDNDNDPDNDPMFVESVEASSLNVGNTISTTYGTIQILASGDYTYTLNNANSAVNGLKPTETLTDIINLEVSDGTDVLGTILTVTISGANDAPLLINDPVTITEDSAPNSASGNVLSNDFDVDGDSLSVTAVNGTTTNVGTTLTLSYGTVSIAAGGAFTYTLDNANPAVQALASGEPLFESVAIEVSDGVVSATSSLLVTILGSNDTPIVNDDTAALTEDAVPDTTTGNALTNDSDIDGDTLTVSAVNGSTTNVGTVLSLSYGTIEVDSTGAYTYTLDNSNPAVQALPEGATVTEAIALDVTDGTDMVGSTLTITITGQNDGPVTGDDTATLTEDAAVNTATGNVLTNDSDIDGDTLNVSSVNGSGANVGTTVAASFGTVEILADGTFTYTLDNTNPAVQALAAGASVDDVISLEVTDGIASVGSTLTITIAGENDAPTIVGSTTFFVDENSPNATSVGFITVNDVDSGDVITFSESGTSAFAVDTNTGEITVIDVNQLDYESSPTFTFTVQVSDGTETDDALVTVNLNDLPEGGPVVLVDGTLVITGDDTVNDNLDILGGAGGTGPIVVTFNDTVFTFDPNDVDELEVNLGDGDDVAEINNVFVPIVLNGGDGDDTLDGSWGNDTINGGAGNDDIEGDPGDDVLIGGGGNDTVAGGSGNDTVVGNSGNDVLIGNTGDDLIKSGGGNDIASGGSGSDIIRGAGGSDTMFGGSGSDLLVGGNGQDILNAGTGGDILLGGRSTHSDNQLRQILDEWTSGGGYATRVNNIRSGAGSLGGTTLTAGSNVLDDNSDDTLIGSFGRDWYFASTSGADADSLFGRIPFFEFLDEL